MNLHRYSMLVMILALLVILSGAYITSMEVAARQSQSAVSLALHEGLHRALAIAFVVLTLGLAIWTTAAKNTGALQAVAWSAAGVGIVDATLGWHAAPLSPTTGVFHPLLAAGSKDPIGTGLNDVFEGFA